MQTCCFPMKIMPICILCMSTATLTPLLLLKNNGNTIVKEKESPPSMCALMFTCLREMGSFQSVNHHTEHQIQKNVEEDENVTDKAEESPCTRKP